MHADIFGDAHRCGYPHYPTYVGYSAILSDNAEVDADIRIRMAIPSHNHGACIHDAWRMYDPWSLNLTHASIYDACIYPWSLILMHVYMIQVCTLHIFWFLTRGPWMHAWYIYLWSWSSTLINAGTKDLTMYDTCVFWPPEGGRGVWASQMRRTRGL